MKYHAFISYRHETESQKLAERLYEYLINKGYRVWFDEVELAPGAIWVEEIKSAMYQSSAVLFILSGEDTNTGWMAQELDAALKAKKRIVPVVTSKEVLSTLPKELSMRQAIVIDEKPEGIDRQLSLLLKEIDSSLDFWKKIRSYLQNDS